MNDMYIHPILFYSILVSYQWYINHRRDKLLKAVKKLPDGKGDFSLILEEALQDWLFKHGKSQNPQTEITSFQDEKFQALPHILSGREQWIPLINSLDDKRFKEVESAVATIQSLLSNKFHHGNAGAIIC